MTKSELIERIAKQMPNLTTKEVEIIVEVIFTKLTTALAAGDRIELRGFGAFSIRARKPRTAVNPKNKKRIDIPARKSVHFKTGRELHKRLNS